MFSEHIKEVLHVFGEGGLEFYYFLGFWVSEFEHVGVQGNPAYDRLLHGRFGIGQLPGINGSAAVHIIGDDGVHLELHLPEQGSQKKPKFERFSQT